MCLTEKHPIPLAARSNAWVCGRSLAGIVGSNPAVEWMCVSCKYYVFSRGGLCDGPILRPEQSYRVSVSECDLETSTMRRLRPQ